MSSPLQTTTDVYLLVLPPVFGFVLSFVGALAVYHCITFHRVKKAYTERIELARRRVRHRLHQCEARDVVAARRRVRKLGLRDLCDSLSDDDGAMSDDSVEMGHRHTHHRRTSGGSGGSQRSQRHHGNHRGSSSRSSFVLDDVRMLDSGEEERSNGS